jgi:hypothetical protein
MSEQPTKKATEQKNAQAFDPAKAIQEMQQQLASMQKVNEEQALTIKALSSMQDKAALHKATKDQLEDGAIRIRLWTWRNKVVVGMDDMLSNNVWMEGHVVKEDQRVRIHFSDGTSQEMVYKEFIDNRIRTEYLDVTETNIKNKQTFYTVSYNGASYTVHNKFIN